MKTLRYLVGMLVLSGLVILIILHPVAILFYPDLPYIGFLGRALYIIILACIMCLYRVSRGPSTADRIVAIDILGIMIIGLCAVLTIVTERGWYIDIGIAWALQSFISTLALSKYLEGKGFDE